MRKCDKAWRPITDQSYLNVLYDAHTYRTNFAKLLRQLRANETSRSSSAHATSQFTPLDPLVWKVRTPFGTVPADHHPCFAKRTALTNLTDSFHFFDRMAPWSANASFYLRAMRIDSSCSGHKAATELWHEMLERLPRDARRVCGRRLSWSRVESRSEKSDS